MKTGPVSLYFADWFCIDSYDWFVFAFDWASYARYYCWHLVLTIWIWNFICLMIKEHNVAEVVCRAVYHVLWMYSRYLKSVVNIDAELWCSLKLVLRRLRLMCYALYQVSWNTINAWGFLFSWYWYKTLVLCTSIIEPSLAVVNVKCTVPSFVKLYYCCFKSLVLTILVQTLLLCIWWSLNMVLLRLMYHVHCTKFCEVLLSLDIFSSKYWYRTLSACDHWTQSCWG